MTVLNVASLLHHAAQAGPDKLFLLSGDNRQTFGQVDQEARKAAHVLHGLGIQPGDAVALLLPNSPLFPIYYYAALHIGAVVMPLHARSASAEVGFALRDANAAALISSAPLHEAAIQGWETAGSHCHLLLAELDAEATLPPQARRLETLLAAVSEADAASLGLYPVEANADAVILFTSGTTDRPKGVRLSHHNLHAIAPQFAELCGLGPDDVLLLFMPATVIVGQIILNVGALLGATISMMPAFDPRQLFNAIEHHRVTFFPMVPMVAQMMLASPLAQSTDLSSLRGVMIGATSVHPELIARFTERFQIAPIIPYGLTECSTISLALPGMNSPVGSVGKPIPGTRLRIVDDEGNPVAPSVPGEIQVRSPHVMQGYFNRPAQTKAIFVDGWLRTGDLGYLDDDGFLFIVERLSDLIKTAGNRVFPAEVERVLELHPAVAQAAVVGKPHHQVGEIVQAFIVLKPGAAVTAKELRDHCRQHLASFKRPRQIMFVEQLPRNPTGKVLRRMLRHAA